MIDSTHVAEFPMPLTFDVPESLSGFAPILEWLSNLPEEQLELDPDLSYFDSFLRSRYGELEFSDAELKIEADRAAIEKLSETYGKGNSWLYFLSAFLTPHIIPNLLNTEEDASCQLPPLTVSVELPDVFKITRDYGSVVAKSPNIEISLIPTAESVLEFKLNNLRQRAQHYEELVNRNNSQPRTVYYFSQVDWGSVNGWKVSVVDLVLQSHKEVIYLLNVPGSACVVEVYSTRADFDERALEESLGTIRVQSTPSN